MFFQFAKIDAKKADEARRREKPLEINEWDNKSTEGEEEEENEKNLSMDQIATP